MLNRHVLINIIMNEMISLGEEIPRPPWEEGGVDHTSPILPDKAYILPSNTPRRKADSKALKPSYVSTSHTPWSIN